MIQGAAIIGIIASILGLGAATFTLLFGGAASAFGTSTASMVVGLGLGGVVFSFAALVASALVFAKPRGAGYAMIVIALAGAVLGGTLVAVFMVLVLIAGILAIAGARAKPRQEPAMAGVPPDRSVSRIGRRMVLPALSVLALAVLLAGGMLLLNSSGPSPAGASSGAGGAARANAITELEAAAASALSPSGELAATFELGSSATDVQRENAFRAIEGQVVVWELPVFDVKRRDDGYRIATEGHVMTLFGPSPRIRTRVFITPRNDAERQQIEALTTGQTIRFKGRIKGVALRQLEIEPAILWTASVLPPAKAQAPASSAVAAGDDIDVKIRHFMTTCRVSAKQKAIQLGGMAPDEADRHAVSTCDAVLPAFRGCISLKAGDAETCAAEVNPSAE